VGVRLDFRHRIAGINATLDDLQSGVEACSRAAEALHTDAAGFGEILKRITNPPLIGPLVKRIGNLQACVRDQRGALRELRRALAQLQEDLKRSNSAVRPPPAVAADRSRR
jgi:hypothetical protein